MLFRSAQESPTAEGTRVDGSRAGGPPDCRRAGPCGWTLQGRSSFGRAGGGRRDGNHALDGGRPSCCDRDRPRCGSPPRSFRYSSRRQLERAEPFRQGSRQLHLARRRRLTRADPVPVDPAYRARHPILTDDEALLTRVSRLLACLWVGPVSGQTRSRCPADCSSSGCPPGSLGVALLRFAVSPGAVAMVWLKRGLPCSK